MKKLLPKKMNHSENFHLIKKAIDSCINNYIITKEGKIFLVSDKFAKTLGYEKSELIGMNGLNLIHNDYQNLVKRNIAIDYRKSYRIGVISKNGKLIFFKVKGKNFIYKNQKYRFTVVKEIKEKEKSKFIDRKRFSFFERMAAGIAHNINNQLSCLIGYADLIMEKEINLTEEAKGYLGIIRTAAVDIAKTINRLKDYYKSKSEGNLFSLININDLVGEVFNFSKPRLEELGMLQKINIIFDIQENLPPFIGIESDLKQALMNLVFNSIDALVGGGEIKIFAYREANKTSKKNGQILENLILGVSDTGIGMDKLTMKHCIEPFFTTKGSKGTGLGLTIVMDIVRNHNGKIDIKSQLSKGTTVKLILPYAKWEIMA